MSNTKQLIIVRKDLEMPVGKLATQVAHASFSAIKECYRESKNNDAVGKCLDEWMSDAYTKVVLEVKNENQLIKYKNIADENKIPNALITDLGRTCFNHQETVTCLGVGPYDNEQLDKLFKRLRLYK